MRGFIVSFDYVVMQDPLNKERTGKPKWSKFYERAYWDDRRRPPRNWKLLQIRDDGERINAWYKPIPPFDISVDPCGIWLDFSDLEMRNAVFMVLKVRNPTFPETPTVSLNDDGSVSAVPKIETDGTETEVTLPFEIATTLDYDLVIEQDTTLGKFCRPDGSPLHVLRPAPEKITGVGMRGGDTPTKPPPPPPLTPTTTTSTPAKTPIGTPTTSRTQALPVVTPIAHHVQKQAQQTPHKRRCDDSGDGNTDSGNFSSFESPMQPPPPPPSSHQGGGNGSRQPQLTRELSEFVREALQPSLDHLRNIIIAKLETIERTTNSMKGSAKQEFKKVLDAVNRAPAEVTTLLLQQQEQQKLQEQEEKQQQQQEEERRLLECLQQQQQQPAKETPKRPKQVAFGETTVLNVEDDGTPTGNRGGGGDAYGETWSWFSNRSPDSSQGSDGSGLATYSCEETDLTHEVLNHRYHPLTSVTTTTNPNSRTEITETPRLNQAANARGRGGSNSAPGFYGIGNRLASTAPRSFRHSATGLKGSNTARRGGGGGGGGVSKR